LRSDGRSPGENLIVAHGKASVRDQMTVWSIFPGNSKYFEPSRASFMVNYIVDDLEALLDRLAKEASTSTLSAKTKATAASPGYTIPTATKSNCGSRTIRDSVESPRNVSEIPGQLGLPDLRPLTGKLGRFLVSLFRRRNFQKRRLLDGKGRRTPDVHFTATL